METFFFLVFTYFCAAKRTDFEWSNFSFGLHSCQNFWPPLLKILSSLLFNNQCMRLNFNLWLCWSVTLQMDDITLDYLQLQFISVGRKFFRGGAIRIGPVLIMQMEEFLEFGRFKRECEKIYGEEGVWSCSNSDNVISAFLYLNPAAS